MLKGTVTGSVWSTKRVDDMPHGAFLEVELEGGSSIVAAGVQGTAAMGPFQGPDSRGGPYRQLRSEALLAAGS